MSENSILSMKNYRYEYKNNVIVYVQKYIELQQEFLLYAKTNRTTKNRLV